MFNIFERIQDAFQQNAVFFIELIVISTLLFILIYEYFTMKNNQVNRQVSSRIGKQDKFKKMNVTELIMGLFDRNEEKITILLKKAHVLFTVKEYITMMAIGTIGGVLVGLIVSPLGPLFQAVMTSSSFTAKEVAARVITAIIFGSLGSQAPRIWLAILIHKRKKLLNEQLQDALLNIADALKSGHVIQEAIRIVGEEMPYPIGPEFQKAYREMETGLTLEASLRALRDRIDLLDFRMAVNAIEIQYEVGGKLEPLLRNMVRIITERQELKKEIEKTIASSKAVGYILLASPWFFVAMFSMVNKATYIKMLTNPIGILMIVLAAVCYAIAAALIVYIIKDVSKES